MFDKSNEHDAQELFRIRITSEGNKRIITKAIENTEAKYKKPTVRRSSNSEENKITTQSIE